MSYCVRQGWRRVGSTSLLKPWNTEAAKVCWAGCALTWMPYYGCVPVQLQEDFLEEAADLYLQRTDQEGAGVVGVAMVWLEVEAQKPAQ